MTPIRTAAALLLTVACFAQDLETPLNFASTADTYGNRPERGRNVMVDSRAILEALDDIYQADRVVAELLTGRLDVARAEAERLRQ